MRVGVISRILEELWHPILFSDRRRLLSQREHSVHAMDQRLNRVLDTSDASLRAPTMANYIVQLQV